MKTAKTGAFLATAVGLMFMANVAMAQGNGAAEAEALWALRPPRSSAWEPIAAMATVPGGLRKTTARDRTPAKARVLLKPQVLRNACKKVGTRQLARMLFDPIYGAGRFTFPTSRPAVFVTIRSVTEGACHAHSTFIAAYES